MGPRRADRAAMLTRIPWPLSSSSWMLPPPPSSQPMKYEAIITLGNNEVIGWWRRTDIINDSTQTAHTENHLIYLKFVRTIPFRFVSAFNLSPRHANARRSLRGRQWWLPKHIIIGFSITFMDIAYFCTRHWLVSASRCDRDTRPGGNYITLIKTI